MKTIFYTRLLLFLGLFLLSEGIYAQNLGCNYKPGDITLTLSGQSQGANISSQIMLLDTNNIIRYKSLINQTTLFNVVIGNYKAVAITFDNRVVPVVEVGKTINDISNCLKSAAIPINICDCNSTDNFISANFPVLSPAVGKGGIPAIQYVLTNGKGVILQIQNTPNFQSITNGVYNVYGACADNSGPIAGLALGGSIRNINSTNLCFATPQSYVVCLPECKLEICIPFSITKIRKI